MEEDRPHILMLAGPNGAGKSTAAPTLLDETLQITEFVNADVIARGLSAFDSEAVAISAGRIMLARLRELARERVNFAFETTLASRSFAPWIATLRQRGYRFTLFYLWLPTVELALERVRERARQGGHSVPPEAVRRRYAAGLRNFFKVYQPLTNCWQFFDSSAMEGPRLIAVGRGTMVETVHDPANWQSVLSVAHAE
jgi:predicted ABC-type ATPase